MGSSRHWLRGGRAGGHRAGCRWGCSSRGRARAGQGTRETVGVGLGLAATRIHLAGTSSPGPADGSPPAAPGPGLLALPASLRLLILERRGGGKEGDAVVPLSDASTLAPHLYPDPGWNPPCGVPERRPNPRSTPARQCPGGSAVVGEGRGAQASNCQPRGPGDRQALGDPGGTGVLGTMWELGGGPRPPQPRRWPEGPFPAGSGPCGPLVAPLGCLRSQENDLCPVGSGALHSRERLRAPCVAPGSSRGRTAVPRRCAGTSRPRCSAGDGHSR